MIIDVGDMAEALSERNLKKIVLYMYAHTWRIITTVVKIKISFT